MHSRNAGEQGRVHRGAQKAPTSLKFHDTLMMKMMYIYDWLKTSHLQPQIAAEAVFTVLNNEIFV